LKYLLLLTIVLSFFSCSIYNSKTAYRSHELESHIDSLINPLIDSSKIAGAAIGISKGGKIIYIKSYGVSDLSTRTPLLVDATFAIASITKTFTAIAVLQLAENGLIQLDDDIRKYLPYNSKGKIITVRQLLNHQSGIKDYTQSAIPGRLKGIQYPKDTLVHMLEQEGFIFEPGTAMGYSNSGYYMLGLIIEKVSGMTYDDYLRKNIYAKAGLNQTCGCDSTRNSMPKLAKGYNTDKTGKLTIVQPGDFKMASAAGSLCSTVADLLKWNIALHKTEKLFTNESYNQMKMPAKLNDGTQVRYGLGLQLNHYKGNPVIFHRGVIEGFLSDARYFPEDDLTIITLINTLGPVKPVNVSNAVSEYFIKEKKLTQVFAGDLTPLAGTYTGKVMGRQLTRNFEVDGSNLFVVIMDKRYSLSYIGNNKWISEDDYIYSFTMTPDIKVQINDPLMTFNFIKEK